MTSPIARKSAASSADRMARSRARRRRGLRCVVIEVRDRELSALVRLGYLRPEQRDDPKKAAHAIHEFLDVLAAELEW
jgi:hypothetical protein